MSSVILDRRDLQLDYEANCLIVRQPNRPPQSVPLTRVQRLVVNHNTQISTRLLGHCQRHGVDFIVLNHRYHDLNLAVLAPSNRQLQARLQQYQLSVDPTQAQPLAQYLLRLKFKRIQRQLHAQTADASQAQLRLQLQHALGQLSQPQGWSSLRGIEGSVQRAVFSYWREQLPPALGFVNRQRRPPPDPVNAVLSLGYTLLYYQTARQCLAAGLDPQLGFYHRPCGSRLSLACDVMEPMRFGVEAQVVALFNSGQLTRRHFSIRQGQCHLGKQGREVFYQHWHQQLPQRIQQLRPLCQQLARYCRKQATTQPTEEYDERDVPTQLRH